MYGHAGWKYMAGQPVLNDQIGAHDRRMANEAKRTMRGKGVAGRNPNALRNKDSLDRHRMSKDDQANMRRTGVMFRAV